LPGQVRPQGGRATGCKGAAAQLTGPQDTPEDALPGSYVVCSVTTGSGLASGTSARISFRTLFAGRFSSLAGLGAWDGTGGGWLSRGGLTDRARGPLERPPGGALRTVVEL